MSSDAQGCLLRAMQIGWRAEAMGSDRWSLQRNDPPERLFLSTTPHWACVQSTVPAGPVAALHDAGERSLMAGYALDGDGQAFAASEVPLHPDIPLLIEDAITAVRHACAFRPSPAPPKDASAGPPGLPRRLVLDFLKGCSGSGWGLAEKPSVPGNYQLTYRGRGKRLYTVWLCVTASWCHFQAMVLPEQLGISADNGQLVIISRYLLRLNSATFMVKFVLSKANKVILHGDLPVHHMSFPLFQTMLDTIATYLERYAQEVNLTVQLNRDKRLRDLMAEACGVDDMTRHIVPAEGV